MERIAPDVNPEEGGGVGCTLKEMRDAVSGRVATRANVKRSLVDDGDVGIQTPAIPRAQLRHGCAPGPREKEFGIVDWRIGGFWFNYYPYFSLSSS